MGSILGALFGLWLLGQATGGRLAARILSYRTFSPGEAPAADQGAASQPAAAGVTASSSSSSGDLGPDSGVLSIDQIAARLLAAGATSEQATHFTGIAMRESAGNTAAHNPVPPDDSYGLFQINRLAWPQFSPAQLSTASGNIAAMLVVSSHFTNEGPWQIGGNPLAHTDQNAARAAVARAQAGRAA